MNLIAHGRVDYFMYSRFTICHQLLGTLKRLEEVSAISNGKTRLLGDQIRSIARLDEVTEPTESPGSSTRIARTVKRMRARKAERARLTVPFSGLPSSSAFIDLPKPLAGSDLSLQAASLPFLWNRLAILTMMF